MNFLVCGALRDHLFEKLDELLAGMSRGGLSMNPAGSGVEGGVERQGSLPVVFKAVPLSASGAKREHRVETIQCLDCSFLVDAEYSGVLRRDR